MKNLVFVTYKPNTHFNPAILRQAAEKADASFVLIQVVAKGSFVEEGAKHYLDCGIDKFLLLEPPPDKPLPPASKDVMSVIATVDDSQPELRLKVIQASIPKEQ
jgi:hypothetical protein